MLIHHSHLVFTLYSVNFTNCFNNVFTVKGSNSERHIAFRCHGPLVSFNKEQFLLLPLFFMVVPISNFFFF